MRTKRKDLKEALRSYRTKRRSKDWFRYIFTLNYNFERLNPEE